MSSREFILDSVRKNQPASRPMPVVPTFDMPLDSVPGALLATFTTALERMGGVVVGLRAGDTLDAFIASRFPTARVFCSATPEFTGMREIGSIKRPTLEDVDVGVVRGAFGIAETGSVWLSEHEFTRKASCRSTWLCCSTRPHSCPTCTTRT